MTVGVPGALWWPEAGGRGRGVPKPLVVLAGLLGAVGASRVVVGRMRTPATRSAGGGACPWL